MKIERILPGMGIRSNVGLMGAAAVTMIEDDLRIIVDVGHLGGRSLLLSALKQRGLTPKDFSVVVLTHIHWDHCLNVDLFEDATILLGKTELESGTLNGKPDIHLKNFKAILDQMKIQPVSESFQPSKNTAVLDTPGHSPGHISLSIRTSNGPVVISGDAIPGLRAYRRGIPDLVFFDLNEAKRSITKVKNIRPNMVIPGHDRPFNESGYMESDDLEFIFRKEKEENLLLRLKNVGSDKPEILY